MTGFVHCAVSGPGKLFRAVDGELWLHTFECDAPGLKGGSDVTGEFSGEEGTLQWPHWHL